MTWFPVSSSGPERLVAQVLATVRDTPRLRAVARALGLRAKGGRAALEARIGASVGGSLRELTELVRLLRRSELAPLCRALGLPVDGDRRDLLDRVEDRLEQQLALEVASGPTPQAARASAGHDHEQVEEVAAWAYDEDEEHDDGEDEDEQLEIPLFPVLLPLPRSALASLASGVGLSPRGGRQALGARLCLWAGRRAERVEAVLARMHTADLRRAADLLELRPGGPREQVLGRLRGWLAQVGVTPAACVVPGAPAGPPLIAGRWALGPALRTDARGAAHEAVDLRLPGRPGRHVAVVAPRPDDHRLRREVELGLRLAHPHAVRAVDVGVDPAGCDVAVFVDPGEPLPAWLARHGRPDAPTAARWLLTVASALDAAHAVGLLHGALELDALWIDPAGAVRVGGFLLAAPPARPGPSDPAPGPDAAFGPVDLGCPAEGAPPAVAPETRAAGYVAPASDRWGLARLAALLLGGRAVERPAELAALELPAAARAALAAGLDPDPRRRPGSCLALALAATSPGGP